MAGIILRSKRTMQPQFTVPASNLSFILNAGNLIQKGFTPLSIGTKPTLVNTAYGVGFNNGYYNTTGTPFPDSGGSGNSQAACNTEHITFVVLSNAALDPIWSRGTSSTDAGPSFDLQNNAGALRVFDGISFIALGNVTVGKQYTFTRTYSDFSPQTTSYYVDGVLITSTAAYRQDGAKQAYIGIGYPNQGVNTAILLYVAKVGKFDTAIEVKYHANNPWQIFSQSRRIYVNSLGGTTFNRTLTATSTSSSKITKQVGAKRKTTNVVSTSTIKKTVGAIRKATAVVSVSKIIKSIITKKIVTPFISVAKAIKKIITTKKTSNVVSTATLTKIRPILRTLTAVTTSTAKIIKQVNAIRKATASVNASKIIKQIGSIKKATSASSAKAIKLIKLTKIATATISTAKAIKKILTTKKSSASVSLASMIRARPVLRTLTAASASLAKIKKQVGAIRKTNSTVSVKFIRVLRKGLSVVSFSAARASKLLSIKRIAIQSETAKVVRQARITKRATNVNFAFLTKIRPVLKTLAATTSSIAKIVKRIGKLQIAISAAISGFKRLIKKSISIASSTITRCKKGLKKTLFAMSVVARVLTLIKSVGGIVASPGALIARIRIRNAVSAEPDIKAATKAHIRIRSS